MAKNVIASCGVAVSGGHLGVYQVVFWYRLKEGRHHEEHYDGLSWTEAVDVIIAESDAHRPGWAIGEGWRQATLDSEMEAL